MTTRRLQLIAVLAFLLAGSAFANSSFVIRELEEPYEETRLRLTMHDEANGRVLVSKCETCPTLTLRIVPDSRLFVNGEEVPLKRVTEFRGRPATVFAGRDTDIVSRISVAL